MLGGQSIARISTPDCTAGVDLLSYPALYRRTRFRLPSLLVLPKFLGNSEVRTALCEQLSRGFLQGKALVDGALSNGVEFFVYSSAERGGEERSLVNPTDIPHFISKHNIEHHLIDSTKGKGMQWTILRPVAFMENMTPGIGTKVMATSWHLTIPKDKPLQLVSIRDIGWFAAQAFLRPNDFAGRSISLAGDVLTLSQANATFKSKVGHEMPQTFSFLVRLLLWYSAEFGNMFRWFGREGFGSDLKALKAEHPGLLSWSDWLEKESEWTKKSS
ncbi:Uu.00g061000.m01.CDS01 [Anthostomella pinea]|uniref:Uu.00g061000.m01.CDS01 n=1 Tax=Anthostomella pinea TaxID=933095 RepID=A0AAI8VSD4_9PEZI|nr:Uu.00g061000.m01.CDS01 [Anthostomella pinea]